ncbi:MAG TPA: hypothetical protein VGH89_31155 [Pseudonocardia sp.]|jgi:hypothetical protein
MSSSFEDRKRRQAIKLFVAAYVAFMLLVVALEMVRNYQFGQGLF